MFLLPLFQNGFVIVMALAASVRTITDKKKRPITWLIDGNNFLGQKGTLRDAELLAERLKPITTEAAEQVTLIFDGRKGETTRHDTLDGPMFRRVQLEEGKIADDFILELISELSKASKSNRVKLVTADKRLRAVALSTKPTVKSVVNPKVFWKKYLPRMSGQKKRAAENEVAAKDSGNED
ncbi:YacP-like NYN domain containing protein [Nitzschia inconspicua]|uniref:YacP-like NYN domain containing protein n=1 Tax=Nitzschia inconspicua TaxID=303405 RepID=A0A9K3KZ31_9STRA|nr:YacP-like NYN domain containing protein [Nitzschia inconspicua]